MPCNGYPSYVCNTILRKLKNERKMQKGHCSDSEDDDTLKICFPVPCIGPFGEKLPESVFRNFVNVPRKNSNLFSCMIQRKLHFFLLNKDPIPVNLQSHVIYQFECPRGKVTYIGKTDRCLELRLNEHSNFRTSAVDKNLYECKHFHHIVHLFNISVYSNSEPSFIEAWYHISSPISRNTRIIDYFVKLSVGNGF